MPMQWEWKNLTDWLRKNLATAATRSSTPTGAITRERLRLTCTPQLQRLLFVERLLNRRPGRLRWVLHLRTLTFIVGARPYWMAVLARSTLQKSHSLSTMLKFGSIKAGTLKRQ